jgi:hypothetical protein
MLVQIKLEGFGLLMPWTDLKMLVTFAIEEIGIKIC